MFGLSGIEGRADAGQDITISSNTTWESGTYTYQDIHITNNATLTLNGAYTDNNNGVGVTINARDVTIDSGSSISAAATGYAGCAGPGAGTPALDGKGGSYGGRGGQSLTDLTYGSALNPSNLGSGGCAYQSDAARCGKGGGAITIVASGQVSIGGSIIANGGNGLSKTGGYQTGGGSGGTININTASITGAGSLTANGGNGYNSGGVGGGGRISVFYDSGDPSNLTFSATKGATGTATSATDGTVFLYDTTNKNLTVNAGLTLEVDEGIDSSGNITSDGSYYFNNLSVGNNSTLLLKGYNTNDSDGVGTEINLSGDLSVASGSSISANGQGYVAASGPGKGLPEMSTGTGAGYGGEGSTTSGGGYGNVAGGGRYGSTLFPEDLGSGGGQSSGGRGGGKIKIVSEGNVSIEGSVSANADNATGYGGGGSGGSIYLVGDEFSGAGTISANGGNGGTSGYGGAGGGGRIALYYSAMSINTNNFSTDGGTGGSPSPADNGTIFLYNTTTGDVEVSQDVTFEGNAGVSRDGTKRTDGVYYFNNLDISNGAIVTIEGEYTTDDDGQGVTINLDGDFTMEAGTLITGVGQGHGAESGPGKGLQGPGNASGGGGSYGGIGGTGLFDGAPGDVYGNNERYYPYFLGSGGGNCLGGAGGSGGSALSIRSLGDVVISGDIDLSGANGGLGLSEFGSGGGSGGSIFLSGHNFSGAGNIKANGGNGGAAAGGGGAGGGGRVSIAYFDTFAMIESNITADGGVGSVTPDRDGADGTVYIRKMDLPSANFNLKNPNNNSTQYTNSVDVEMDPEDPDADEYYESSNGDLTPAFYAPGWHKVTEGKQLSAGDGPKTVKAWLKDDNQLISAATGEATITLDQTNPLLSVTQSGNNTTTSSTILVSGTASDALSGIDYVSVDGQHIAEIKDVGPDSFTGEIVSVKDGAFFTTLELDIGENIISIAAYDKAGNNASTEITVTRVAASESPTITATPSSESDGSSGSGDGGDEESEDGTETTTPVGSTPESAPTSDGAPTAVDFDQMQIDNDGNFVGDGNKLTFYTNNPVISGVSEPNANIKIYLNGESNQTSADEKGKWRYQFNDLKEGVYDLIIDEYRQNGELIRSTSYEMNITGKPKGIDAVKSWLAFSWWWLLLIIIAIITYWYLRSRYKAKPVS